MSEHPGASRWRRIGRVTAYALFLLAAAAIPLAIDVPIDNRLELFLNPDSETGKQYEAFREVFGSDEFVIAAYSGKDVFDTECLDVQLDVYDVLVETPGIKRISGVPAVYAEIFGAEDADALRDDFLLTPFYHDFLISRDGKVAGILIETEEFPGVSTRREVVDAINAALEPLRDYGMDVHVIGPPVLHVVTEDISQSETRRMFPIALICSALIMLFLFRSIRLMLVAVCCTAMSVVLTIGLMGATGYTLNMVTSVMPVMLWVLTLANLFHILRRYQEHRAVSGELSSSLTRALRETWLPCTLASATTALAFLSLLVAVMGPIRQLGAFSAAGLMISLVVNLSVGPVLVEWFRAPGLARRNAEQLRWTDTVAAFSTKYGWLILGVSAAVAVLTLVGLSRIRVEANSVSFLPEDSPTVQSYEYVSQNLAGLYTLEVVVKTPNGWLDSSTWAPIEALCGKLGQAQQRVRVVSALDFLKKLNEWDSDFDPEAYRLPESSEKAAALFGELDESAQAELRRLVSEDGKTMRISVLLSSMDSTEFMAMVEQAEGCLAELPEGMSGYVTGIVLQLLDTQFSLVETQVRSFGLAFLSVFFCILIGLRSWRMTLLSFAPNLLPILSVFGLMALAGVALDAATVMVASLALGVAVDHALHLLIAYQRARKKGEGPEEASRAALRHVGPAMVITTVTACIGFFALAGSQFIPIFYFGLLSGFATVAALAANMLLVPAIVTRRLPWRASARKS